MAISTDSLPVATALDSRQRPQGRPSSADLRERWLRRRRAPGIGLVMAVATAALLGWGLGRPALWLDESASVLATQRSWPQLWRLLEGGDAPLVPYYAVLKLLTGAATALVPPLAHHPEVLARAPSLVAVVLAGQALVTWLARSFPAPLAVGTGCAFLLTSGVSRYGQEARPYGIVVLAAVLATIAWTWAVADRRYVVVYAASVFGLMAGNPLAGTLVLAHLVTAAGLGRGRRRPALLRTLAGAALGVATVLPLALTMADHGGGASLYPPTTWRTLLQAFVGLSTLDATPLLGIGPLLVLALIGAVRAVSPGSRRYRSVARLALAWAVVPPAALLPAVLLRPNLLIGRYLMFTVPGWAILAGLGLVTITAGARRVTTGLLGRGGRAGRPQAGRVGQAGRAGQAAAVVTAALLLVGVGVEQLPSLRLIRTADGHGADPRAAFADADEPAWAGLPIIPSTRSIAMQMGAYDRAREGRLSGLVVQRDRVDIWPLFLPGGVRRELTRRYPRAVLLLQPNERSADCRVPQTPVRDAFVARCMPRLLQQLDYRVETVRTHGRGVVFAVVARPSPLRLRPVRNAHALSDHPGTPRTS